MRKFLILLLVTVPVFAGEITEDPLERRMLDIASGLRCTVCQNQPVSESNAELARDIREMIREQLVAGKSRQEIVDYFVARYGNFILMKPPFAQSGRLLWLAPGGLLLGIAIGAWSFLRNRRKVELPPVAPLSKEDRARVKAAEAADDDTLQKGDTP
ncbi:MAG: cytochrome c-type biogenesis protein CcmH [Acidiferrobacterales bacterium]